MRVMLLAFLATIVIAIGANFALKAVDFSTTNQAVGTAVRY